MSPELERLAEESDNPIEFFFAAIIYEMVAFILRIMEVVLDLGSDTQSTD